MLKIPRQNKGKNYNKKKGGVKTFTQHEDQLTQCFPEPEHCHCTQAYTYNDHEKVQNRQGSSAWLKRTAPPHSHSLDRTLCLQVASSKSKMVTECGTGDPLDGGSVSRILCPIASLPVPYHSFISHCHSQPWPHKQPLPTRPLGYTRYLT